MKAEFWIKWLLVLSTVLFGPSSAWADPWTFSLDPPAGAISGTPGSSIGWGYTISNQSATNWLMLTGLSSDPFANATPDASLFTFPILAPGTAFSVAYSPAALEGLFQITWDANAPVGFTNTGTFVLSGEFWDADPLAGGNFVLLGFDQSAAYSASVSAGSTSVPEPSTLLLIIFGITGLLLQRQLFRRGSLEA